VPCNPSNNCAFLISMVFSPFVPLVRHAIMALRCSSLAAWIQTRHNSRNIHRNKRPSGPQKWISLFIIITMKYNARRSSVKYPISRVSRVMAVLLSLAQNRSSVPTLRTTFESGRGAVVDVQFGCGRLCSTKLQSGSCSANIGRWPACSSAQLS
jgi:hypothetical protein